MLWMISEPYSGLRRTAIGVFGSSSSGALLVPTGDLALAAPRVLVERDAELLDQVRRGRA